MDYQSYATHVLTYSDAVSPEEARRLYEMAVVASSAINGSVSLLLSGKTDFDTKKREVEFDLSCPFGVTAIKVFAGMLTYFHPNAKVAIQITA